MTRYKINSAVLAFAISFGLTGATLLLTTVPVQSASASYVYPA